MRCNLTLTEYYITYSESIHGLLFHILYVQFEGKILSLLPFFSGRGFVTLSWWFWVGWKVHVMTKYGEYVPFKNHTYTCHFGQCCLACRGQPPVNRSPVSKVTTCLHGSAQIIYLVQGHPVNQHVQRLVCALAESDSREQVALFVCHHTQQVRDR